LQSADGESMETKNRSDERRQRTMELERRVSDLERELKDRRDASMALEADNELLLSCLHEYQPTVKARRSL